MQLAFLYLPHAGTVGVLTRKATAATRRRELEVIRLRESMRNLPFYKDFSAWKNDNVST